MGAAIEPDPSDGVRERHLWCDHATCLPGRLRHPGTLQLTQTPDEGPDQQRGVVDAPLLSVEELSVKISTEDGTIDAVDRVGWSVARGQVLGIVGESGSGK